MNMSTEGKYIRIHDGKCLQVQIGEHKDVSG